ncbi:cytochrome c oxidase subunit II [Magnetococcales bacterium HHB-1]
MLGKSKTAASLLAGAATLLGPAMALADLSWSIQEPVTPVAEQILALHDQILVTVWIIGILVFGLMFYAMFKFRKDKGAVAAKFHDNLVLEIIWTIIPFAILISIAIPATETLKNMEDTSKSDITIKATGIQWKWKYDYLDEGVSFMSILATPRKVWEEDQGPKGEHYLLDVDNPVVVPVNKKIRILTTATDVIHSWYVPALGVKKDSIPGFINETWFKATKIGTYRGQCTELCGKEHGFMPIVVEVKSQKDYDTWLAGKKAEAAAAKAAASQTWDKDKLMAKGGAVYADNCAGCHGDKGQGDTENGFPALTGSKVATGPADKHIDVVMNGVDGTAMAAYAEMLSDAEIAAVVTFERNGLGNSTGDIVQPKTITGKR